jgi:hypothetical protein
MDGARRFPAAELVEQLRSWALLYEIRCAVSLGTKRIADFLRFPFDIARQTRTIRRLLDQTRFDLVYVNGARLFPAASIAVQGRAPIVFHAHWCYAGAAAWMAGWSVRRSDATVMGCCRYVTAPLDVPECRLHVIPNGSPIVASASAPSRRRRILASGIIGGSRPRRAGRISARGALLAPEFSARFVICGAPLFADQRYEDEMRRRSMRLPVEFLGWRDDIASVLEQLDLLVIASSEEGLPRVLLEAFSAECRGGVSGGRDSRSAW